MPVEKIKRILLNIAIIFVVSFVCRYSLGNIGYITFDEVAILLLARSVNPGYAMMMAALPTSLVDIFTSRADSAPYTFIIRAIEGFLFAYIFKKHKCSFINNVLIVALAMILQCVVDVIMFGSNIILTSVLYNVIQFCLTVLLYWLYLKITKTRE